MFIGKLLFIESHLQFLNEKAETYQTNILGIYGKLLSFVHTWLFVTLQYLYQYEG